MAYHNNRGPHEVRFLVIATVYPDLDPGYDGPALTLEEQVQGVQREWPVYYGTRGEAEAAMAHLNANPDPSFCQPGDVLHVAEIAF